MTDDLHLFTEDGTEYVLPANFFAGPLKPGTRGKAGPRVYTVVTGKPDEIGNIVVLNAQGTYVTIDPRYFTPDPDPDPPTTVMVEMSTEWAQKWANDSPYPPDEATTVYTQAENEVIQACRKALKKAGME